MTMTTTELSALEKQLEDVTPFEEMWGAISSCKFYEGPDSDPSLLREIADILYSKAGRSSGDRQANYLAAYVRLAMECGVSLIRPPSRESRASGGAEDWLLTTDQLLPFLASRQDAVRREAALSLNLTRCNLEGVDGAGITSPSQLDELGAAALRLLVAREHYDSGRRRELSSGRCEENPSNSTDQMLARLLEIAALTLLNQELSDTETQWLLALAISADRFPLHWGLGVHGSSLRVADLTLEILEGARLHRPAHFSRLLLEAVSTRAAQRVAFAVTFLVQAERFPYGVVLDDLDDEERQVLLETEGVPADWYLRIGIGRFELSHFIAGKRFRYRRIPVELADGVWLAPLAAIVMRVALEQLDAQNANSALNAHASPEELLDSVFLDFKLATRRIRDVDAEARVREFAETLLHAALPRLKRPYDLLMNRIAEVNLDATDVNCVAAAIKVYLEGPNPHPGKIMKTLVEVLRSDLSTEALSPALDLLSVEELEKAIQTSGHPRWVRCCPTERMFEWLLETSSEDDVDFALELTAAAEISLLASLATKKLDNPIGKLVLELALADRGLT